MQAMIYGRPTAARPKPPEGMLTGALLTAALIAVSYSAWRLAGLPFLPFDVLDWVTRALPGFMVTLSIDTMISLIGALGLGTTAGGARTVEQALAIVGMWAIGTATGGALFALLRLWRSQFAMLLGAICGIAVGALAAFISQPASHAAGIDRITGAVWITGAFCLWGLALGWSYRRQRLMRVAGSDRRKFIAQFAGVTATITLAGFAFGKLFAGGLREAITGELWSDTNAAPNAGAIVKAPLRTRPELTPVSEHFRTDINMITPAIREDKWRLEILGLVERPQTMTLDELRRDYTPLHQFVTLSCISNPVGGDAIGTQRWTGVSVQQLLERWRLNPEATHLKFRSADGFFEVVSIEAIQSDPRVMLTYAWDGVPLTRGHGFPLRLYVPDTYGMKLPKWIVSVEAVDRWQPGYWVTRGWSADGIVKATAVIDTIGAGMKIAGAREGSLTPIGGIAYAGARGISKVEIQVDGGEWVETQLRDPLSSESWAIWRYDWPLRHGLHTFTVRCVDGNGQPQIARESGPRPDGATGLHSKTMLF